MGERQAADCQRHSAPLSRGHWTKEPGSYSIDAKTQLGTIATDFAGDVHRRFFLVGRSFATGNTPASHRIYVRMGYGGITVKTLPKEAYPPSE